MTIKSIDADQIKSLSEIGISASTQKKIEEIVIRGLNNFFDKGDLNGLNFTESVEQISGKIKDILDIDNNKQFFREKLKSITKAVLNGIDLTEVLGKKIYFEVFPPGSPFLGNADNKKDKSKEKSEHPDRSPRKYWTMQALKEWGVKYEVRSSKERKDGTEPYGLFFVPEYNCVIAVADEYGKATYFLPMKNWQKLAKSHKIDNLRPNEKVKWLSMPNNIGKEEWGIILGEKLLEMQRITEENEGNGKISRDFEKKNIKKKNFESKEEEIAYYRKFLEAEIPRLIDDVGLIKHNGKYIFSFLKNTSKWGKVQNFGSLLSFPNAVFLRQHKIVDKQKMSNPNQLKKLFEVLGLPVANENDEKEFYRALLEAEIPRLIKEAGLIEHNGKYIFSFLNGYTEWGKVQNFGSLSLRSFPNIVFLRQHEIVDKRQMSNPNQLKKLFEVLGLPVANENDEKEFYRALLEAEIPRLIDEVGLIKHNGKYNFSFIRGLDKWEKVQNFGNLRSFPNAVFLKQYEIANKQPMSNPNQLKKLFEVLGLPVANENDEKEFYRTLLEAEIPRLIKEARLIKHNEKYIFSLLNGYTKWGEVQNFGSLKSFPNAVFLRQHKIIKEKNKAMTSIYQLKKLFEVLGVPVANETDEKEFYRALLETEISRLIREVGLIEHDEKYFFSFFKNVNNWGKVQNFCSLIYFPRVKFLRKYKIIEQEQIAMTKPSQLKKLFEILDLPVASAEEEQEYLKSHK